jgi:hypothetical protein
MAAHHDEIIRNLGDGWSLAWDTTEVDPATQRAMDKVVKTNVAALKQALAATARPDRRAA